jgi:hypothetical protein
MYAPPCHDFAYVDNPGFADTRGLELDIANAFFREQVTKPFTHMKFAILVTYQSLIKDQGKHLRQSIKLFAEYLGVFERDGTDAIIDSLSKSIGLIATRGERKKKHTLPRVKQILKNIMLQILDDMKEHNDLAPNVEKCFRSVLDNEQISVFSTPYDEGPLDDMESGEIKSMLSTLSYVEKEQLDVRVKLGEQNIAKLLAYLQLRNEEFEKQLETSILKNAVDYSAKEMININEVDKVRKDGNPV